jgi:hypothetical protein
MSPRDTKLRTILTIIIMLHGNYYWKTHRIRSFNQIDVDGRCKTLGRGVCDSRRSVVMDSRFRRSSCGSCTAAEYPYIRHRW